MIRALPAQEKYSNSRFVAAISRIAGDFPNRVYFAV